MAQRLISADNHIDITSCPRDLWADPPTQWQALAPRVEEREDGGHWIINGQDTFMWNGFGPVGRKYKPGLIARIDRMRECGFEWDNHEGATPRVINPALRLADLERDGIDAEIVYGALLLNNLIKDKGLRIWCSQRYNDWTVDFARRTDPKRVFPLAIIPNSDPLEAATEVRRCAKMGLRGGDLAFLDMALPLYHRAWDSLWEAAQECDFPISFHTTGFRHGLREPDCPEMEQTYFTQLDILRMSMFQVGTMEVLVSLLASGACERYPGFKFVLAESGVTWLPYMFDRMDTLHAERGEGLGLSMPISDYFRRQGYVTYQQDGYLAPAISIVGEDNIMWGADYPHPDCTWPDSQAILDKNLADVPPAIRRKITCDNVAKLYKL
jgi:predicted TIM-barrel fold metal-dependent hydrolase